MKYDKIISKCKKCEHYYKNNCVYDCMYFMCFDKNYRCKGFKKSKKVIDRV